MIQILLITHAAIGQEMVAAVAHIMGNQPVVVFDFKHDTPREESLAQLTALIAAGGNDGALLLTDIFGSTPCNLAAPLLALGRVEMVTGLNLPMLIKACEARQRGLSLHNMAEAAMQSGREHIHFAPTMRQERG